MFTSPGQIAFSLFGYKVHWYGIIMGISIMLGIFVVLKLRKKYYNDISEDSVLDLAFWLILSGIICARLYYVSLDFQFYFLHPLLIFAIWNGGLAIHGAIIGAVIAGYIFIRKNKYNFLRYADLFIFGLVTGQITGRWGNFFNSEAFGIPTNLPWKLYIPPEYRPMQYFYNEYFHPTFLYESLLNLIILIILLLIQKFYTKKQNGFIFFAYLILYSFVRYFVESLRTDSILTINNFHIAQIMCILMSTIGIIGILYCANKKLSKK